MNDAIGKIIGLIKETSGFDFSGNRPSMIARRIESRLPAVNLTDPGDYPAYLEKNPDELKLLIDALTINVSSFFRDTLTFAYLAEQLLPAVTAGKAASTAPSLRIWSAGCATGEEPYSIAILMHEWTRKEKLPLDVHIIATDMDEAALALARKGAYSLESIKDMKHRYVTEYFSRETEAYVLSPEIKKMVTFSSYDLLDRKTHAPPESIFGDFDLILCRNVLIYFQTDYQEIILDKLVRSLTGRGYLVLGEAELPTGKYQRHLRRVNECCHIYQKK